MTKYIATIRHHSIASARTITVEGSLTAAKRAATIEFGGEQRDYEIVIFEQYPRPGFADGCELAASRCVGSPRWSN